MTMQGQSRSEQIEGIRVPDQSSDAKSGKARNPSFGPSALATPANALSAARILATPAMITVIIAKGPSIPALLIWLVLGGTDWVDGWIARRQGTTRSGAFLDPLADKFLVLGAFSALAVKNEVSWLPIALIAGRELAISMYRTKASKKGISVPASFPAKIKTLVQDVAITLALIPKLYEDHGLIVTAAVWAAVTLTVATGLHYFYVLRKADLGGVAANSANAPASEDHSE